MGTITISVNDEVEKKFRETTNRVVGAEKGNLGKAVAEAMAIWIREKEQEEIRQRALKRLKSGYKMGKLLYKNRSELYER